jgi:hypothetical protein
MATSPLSCMMLRACTVHPALPGRQSNFLHGHRRTLSRVWHTILSPMCQCQFIHVAMV